MIIVAISIDYLIQRNRIITNVVMPMKVYVPKASFITAKHVWFDLKPSGSVYMGIDSIITNLFNKINKIEHVKVGQRIKAGETIFVIKSGDKSLDIKSPMDCVIEHNNISSLEGDPYGKNWICQVAPSDLEETIKQSHIGVRAGQWINSELTRLRDAVVSLSSTASAMADGGMPQKGFALQLNNDEWKTLVKKFF